MHKFIELSLLLGGLLLTAIGAGIAARAVIITEEQANTLSGTYYNGNQALKKSLLSQSRGAKIGLILIVIGTALQIAGTIFPLLN